MNCNTCLYGLLLASLLFIYDKKLTDKFLFPSRVEQIHIKQRDISKKQTANKGVKNKSSTDNRLFPLCLCTLDVPHEITMLSTMAWAWKGKISEIKSNFKAWSQRKTSKLTFQWGFIECNTLISSKSTLRYEDFALNSSHQTQLAWQYHLTPRNATAVGAVLLIWD